MSTATERAMLPSDPNHPAPAGDDRSDLEGRIASLEAQVTMLTNELQRLVLQLGLITRDRQLLNRFRAILDEAAAEEGAEG
jgi:hypothetical protein